MLKLFAEVLHLRSPEFGRAAYVAMPSPGPIPGAVSDAEDALALAVRLAQTMDVRLGHGSRAREYTGVSTCYGQRAVSNGECGAHTIV